MRQVTIALLAAEAASVAYALVGVPCLALLPSLLARNVIPNGPRNAFSGSIGAGCIVAAVVWFRSKRWSDEQAERVSRLARRVSPLLVVWVVLPLLSLGAFRGRALDLLLLTGMAVIGAEATVRLRRARPAPATRKKARTLHRRGRRSVSG